MSNKILDACHKLIEEMFIATGFPDTPFTITLAVEPLAIAHPAHPEEEGTSYVVKNITINEIFWSMIE